MRKQERLLDRGVLVMAADVLDQAERGLPASPWSGMPWEVTECSDKGLGECPCIVYQGVHQADPFQPQGEPVRYIADAETPEYAKLIALMGANAAKAAARWLRAEARNWTGDENHYDCDPEGCTALAALTFAESVLGGTK